MDKPDIATLIDSHFEEMTELEQEIARYFLQAETIADDLSSQQVTQKLHISQAALTRFSKKCGFTGYREFIFQYLHQAKKQDTHSHKHSPLTNRVLRSYSNMREQTQGLIDEEQLERIAQLIEDADRVYFFGTGSSGLVAREMKLRFMRLGVVCEALTDQDGFAWTTSILDSSCLVIGFSLSGGTNSITDSLLNAKEKGAKTVLLTANPAAIHQGFTEVLPAAPLPSSTYIDRISAILPLLIVVDLIYAHFLNKSREQKEIVFNSYWENKKLSSQRSRKS